MAATGITPLAARERTIRPGGASPRVAAVIFDLDGTLLDTEPLHRAAFQAAAASLGYEIDSQFYGKLIGLATPDRTAHLVRHFGASFPAASFVAEYYRQKQRCLDGGVMLKPGALALLDWLQRQQIPRAIATASSSRTARRHLVRAGLEQCFAAVLTRDDVARRKPHPDLFLRAAAALGVARASCLVVEDSAPGIEAAHAAGMAAILVPDLAPIPPHIRMKSLAVLPDLHTVRALLAEN